MKLIYILAATAAILVFSGCHKEDDPVDPKVLSEMFHFTALEGGLEVSMKLESDTLPAPTLPSLLYSTDGKNWIDFIPEFTTVKVSQSGDKVYIKANDSNKTFAAKIPEGTNGYYFSLSRKCKVSGFISYLLDADNPSSAPMEETAFAGLFYSCDNLVDASELTLPSENLSILCCFNMFAHSGIVSPPVLPATEMEYSCYHLMFFDCKDLVYAPELPATKLDTACYSMMFWGCSSLTTAPALPATELVADCYYRMFCDCTSLASAPELPSTQLAERCYSGMFQKCSSLLSAPSLPAPTLKKGCYKGMFSRCTSLTEATVLARDITVEDCVSSMFNYITTTGTLTVYPGVDWSGVVPTGWDVEYVQ